MLRVSFPSFVVWAIAATLSALPSSPAVASSAAERKALLNHPSSVGIRAAQTISNGILSVEYEDTTGQFSIATGSNHPVPNESVFFPVGTSYITLRDVNSLIMWVNETGVDESGLAGYTLASMLNRPVSVTRIANGFRTVYSLPNFEVTQDVAIRGTTLSDTAVMHQVRVRNISEGTRSFGLRYMWDWQIADNDDALFRRRSPDSPFTDVFQTFSNPDFRLYEQADDAGSATFSIFGSVRNLPLSPAPTPPDQVRYASWGRSFDSAWDFPNTGSGDDSAVDYYWGFNTPISLASGGTATFTQYATTQFEVFAQGPTITSFTPASGAPGQQVIITGTGFTGATRLTFNGAPAQFTVNSPTRITAIVPANATTGRIVATTPRGTATSATNFVVPTVGPPRITTITPLSGVTGTTITVRGANFQRTSCVTLGGQPVNFRVVNSSTITFSVPDRAAGVVRVTTPVGTATSTARFANTTHFNPAIIRVLTPQGRAGSQVQLWGRGLKYIQEVRFNGVLSPNVRQGNAFEVFATVPAGAAGNLACGQRTMFITVKTPHGYFITENTFTVIP